MEGKDEHVSFPNGIEEIDVASQVVKKNSTMSFDEEMRIFNERFRESMLAIIKWYESERGVRDRYPKGAARNKSKFRSKVKQYSVCKGILYKHVKRSDGIERKLEVILDYDRQERLIESCHYGITKQPIAAAASGHYGRDRIYAILYERYVFPKMKERIMNSIRTCETCQLHGAMTLQKTVGHELNSIKVPPSPWKQVGIDLIGPFPPDEGMRYLCIAVDYFSKYPEAQAIPTKSAIHVARFLHSLMCRYGQIPCIISDNGTEFNAEISRNLFRICGVRHQLASPYHPQSCGQIERTNRTVQEVMKKVIEKNDEWVHIIPSVMFSMRVARSASTGFSPHFLLFQNEPVLPFQFVDCNTKDNSVLKNTVSDESVEDIFDMIEEQRGDIFGGNAELTKQKRLIYTQVENNIANAQKKQKKWYDKRHSGPGLEIGDKVLKKNMKEKVRLQKGTKKFTGPYTVTGIARNGSYYLRDKFSHQLLKPVSAVQLVRFREKEQVAGLSNSFGEVSDDDSLTSAKEFTGSCQRAEDMNSMGKTSTPNKTDVITSQLVIMKSTDSGLSSDECSAIDITGDVQDDKSFWTMNADTPVDDIDIEIMDEYAEEVVIPAECPPTPVFFLPVTFLRRKKAASLFNISLKEAKHDITYNGVGKELKINVTPTIRVTSAPDGNCLYSTLSYCLTGKGFHHYVLRHVICNYIQDVTNYDKLKEHIPMEYNSGLDYVNGSRQRVSGVWGTDLELYTFSIMTGIDLYVYSEHGTWQRYSRKGLEEGEPTEGLFISHASGCHFDSIWDCYD